MLSLLNNNISLDTLFRCIKCEKGVIVYLLSFFALLRMSNLLKYSINDHYLKASRLLGNWWPGNHYNKLIKNDSIKTGIYLSVIANGSKSPNNVFSSQIWCLHVPFQYVREL